MKKLISALSLFLCCLAASAQPTSFGGITPGQTTREELKSLVKEPQKVGAEDSLSSMELKQPEGIDASFRLRNDVVYEVTVGISFKDELRQALIEKYGAPSIKVGGIRTVTCKNNFGASFERLAGKEELRWKVKDGVQGAIGRFAGDCGLFVIQSYILRHLATITAIEGGKADQARKAGEEARRKLGNAY
jgi:hypothetical protein